ncbi:DUF2399 domain-containing protein, partial [Micromonospora sp. NPDC002389]|uniref:DUF2399 domain-containing protein n=1 Tax=Micromonospora sp. NPDC002389 TaxID=3154272 RepID=UPI0033269030
SAAAPDAPPRSSKPSSPYITSRPAKTHDEKRSVVENPSVLEIALIRRSRIPLACTSGQLRAVDHVLLQLAIRCGAHIRYAGDIDTAGLQIADAVVRLYNAELLAMDPMTVHAATKASSKSGEDPTGSTDGQNIVVFQEHDVVLARIFGKM